MKIELRESLNRTPVDYVDAYFLATADGSLELFQMHRIDFEEAAAAHPNDWALAEDYNMPAGPDAPKIVDKRDVFVFPKPQTEAPPQAMVAMQPDRIQNLMGRLRSDPSHRGGPLSRNKRPAR